MHDFILFTTKSFKVNDKSTIWELDKSLYGILSGAEKKQSVSSTFRLLKMKIEAKFKLCFGQDIIVNLTGNARPTAAIMFSL